MAKKTTPKTGQHVSSADRIRLGSKVADAKAKIDSKTWKKLVTDAHARGRTVQSQLFEGNMPDALRERTKASLKTEAEKTIADAYTPATAELDSAQARAKALSAKRAGDNIAYRSWLEGEQAKQAAASAGAQQRYEQYLQGQQAVASQDIQGAAQAAAQGTPGTVSNMADSTAIKGLSADEKRNEANVAAARAQTAAMIPSVNMQQQNLALATRATFDAAEAKRTGDENKDLTDIFTARDKLATTRAADAIKEYTRLLDGETTKAQSNRDYNAAAEKLALDSFKADQQASQFTATLKVKTAAQKLAEKKVAQDKATADAKTALGYDRIKADQGKAAADRALKKKLAADKIAADKAKNTGPDGKTKLPGAAELAKSQTQDAAVVTISNKLVELHNTHPAGTVNVNGKAVGYREYLRSKGYSDLQIDVAEDLRKHGGKLSAAGREKAKRIGILDPGAVKS